MHIRNPIRSILLVAAMLGGMAPSAAAQQAAPTSSVKSASQSLRQRKAAAKASADRGFELFSAGKYAEALVAFQEADKQFHAPTFAVMIARMQDKLGQLLEARAIYQRVVDEQFAHYAPRAFLDAQEQAKAELDALIPRIPTVQVLATGAPMDAVQLVIDGAPAQIGQKIPRNPGDHTITASAAGYVAATKQVTLQEATPAQVTLELTPEVAAAPPPAPPPRAKAAPVKSETPKMPVTSQRRYVLPGVSMLGFAGLVLGVGAATGAGSSTKVDQLERQCPDTKCYNNADGTYSSAHTLAAVSTVSFVLGGLLAAGGVVLLAMDSGGAQPARTGLVVGPGSLSVKGGF